MPRIAERIVCWGCESRWGSLKISGNLVFPVEYFHLQSIKFCDVIQVDWIQVLVWGHSYATTKRHFLSLLCLEKTSEFGSSDIKMVIQVIICEQTNLNRSRSSTVFGSDCLIEMPWIHLRGCTIVPRFTIKPLRARTSSRILLSFSNGQGFNSRYLDVFPNNIIVYLQGLYLKNRVAGWGCDWDPNIIVCELTFW